MVNDRVLISGSNGFIGRALTPYLAEKGFDVYALERYVSNRYNIPYHKKIKTVFTDLTNHVSVDGLIRQIKPEFVVHLAALSPVSVSYDRWQEVLETNFNATANLAECLRRHDPNLKQFVYAATSECYGNQKVFPIKETAEFKPNSPYAVSKVAAVSYLKYMRDAYDFPVTLLFPFNSYGRRTTHFVVERIISQMLAGKTIYLGDPDPIRDLLYIDDHVEGYASALGYAKALGESFNLCTGKGASIREVVDMLREIIGFDGEVVWGTIPKRPLDILKLVGDNSKAYDVLGWSPKFDLFSGLEKTVELLKVK